MLGKTISQVEIQKNDLEQINIALKAMGEIYATEGNVHHHSRRLAALSKPFFTMDEKYGLSQSLSTDFKTACQEILAYAQNNELIKATLKTIENAKGNERETGLNPRDLLTKIWRLAKLQPHNSNARELVLDNLIHNRRAGGSCLAGIMTRLIHPYSFFISECMKERYYGVFQSQDDDLEIALAHSIQTPPASYFNEDEQLKLALELSQREVFQSTSYNQSQSTTKYPLEQGKANVANDCSATKLCSANKAAVKSDEEFAKELAQKEAIQLSLNLSKNSLRTAKNIEYPKGRTPASQRVAPQPIATQRIASPPAEKLVSDRVKALKERKEQKRAEKTLKKEAIRQKAQEAADLKLALKLSKEETSTNQVTNYRRRR